MGVCQVWWGVCENHGGGARRGKTMMWGNQQAFLRRAGEPEERERERVKRKVKDPPLHLKGCQRAILFLKVSSFHLED